MAVPGMENEPAEVLLARLEEELASQMAVVDQLKARVDFMTRRVDASHRRATVQGARSRRTS
jgi:hypothetical protein